jgi:hypothetical protein
LIAAGGVPDVVGESRGTAVTVTAGGTVTGIARSAVSDNVAVVVWGPGTAVAEMSTPTEIADRDVSAVDVHVRTRVDPESAHVHPLPEGEDAKVSPDGSVAMISGKWYAVPDSAGERVNV